MQGQYAQIGQRPRHPGTLVDYKRNFRADLVGVSHRTRREPLRWAEADDLVTVGVTVDGQLAGADGEIAAVERAGSGGDARPV